MPRERLRKEAKILLEKSREAAMLAVCVYNNPITIFKSRAYIVLMNIAWTSLLHSIFKRDKIKYYYRDNQDRRKYVRIDGEPKTWDLSKSAKEYFKDHNNPIYKNVQFFIGLRNKIEHSFAPEIDSYIFGESQSYLINFEEILTKEYSDEYALADSLIFALQYSKMKTSEQYTAIKKAQSKDFEKLKTLVDDFRMSLDDSILSNPSYAFKVFLIPKPANRMETADYAIEFIKYDPNKSDEMENYKHLIALIKEKKVPTEKESKKFILVNEPKGAHDRVLLVKSGKSNGYPTVGLVDDPNKANGILVYPEISEDAFTHVKGIVDTALILKNKTGEFPLSEKAVYLVYSEREKVSSYEACEIFLKGSYYHKRYVPFFYWLTMIESANASEFIRKCLSEMHHPKVLNIFRLIIASENDEWLNYLLEIANKQDEYTQKPEWYWNLKNMIDRKDKVSTLYATTDLSCDQDIFSHKVEELTDNIEIANAILSQACSDYATSAGVDYFDIRKLDLIVYSKELISKLPITSNI